MDIDGTPGVISGSAAGPLRTPHQPKGAEAVAAASLLRHAQFEMSNVYVRVAMLYVTDGSVGPLQRTHR